MSPDFITGLILEYRYWILVPLSFIEGPVIAFIAGMLASVGYFNLYFLAGFFFIRDVGLDALYYAVGHFGNKTAFAARMLKKLGITPDHLKQVHDLWQRRPGPTMLIGKLSYGIASAFIVVAGMVRMPLPAFFFYASVVAVLQYGTLLFLGYFLGASAGGGLVHLISNLQYVIAFATLAISGYYLFTWYMRGKLLKTDEEIEKLPSDAPGRAE